MENLQDAWKIWMTGDLEEEGPSKINPVEGLFSVHPQTPTLLSNRTLIPNERSGL